MGEAVMIGVAAALGLFTLGLGVCVLGKLPPLPQCRTVQPAKEFSMGREGGHHADHLRTDAVCVSRSGEERH